MLWHSRRLRINRALVLGLCLGIRGLLAGAAAKVPAAPKSMVLDEGRMLGAAATENVSHILQDSVRDTGVAAYFVTTAFLDTSETRERLQALIERWLRDRPGIILMCNRSNGQFGITASPGLWSRYPADEVSQILSGAGHALGTGAAPQDRRIQDSVVILDAQIRRLVSGHLPQVEGASAIGGERRLGYMMAAVIFIAGAAIWLISLARRRKRSAMGGPFWFPEAKVVPRLGGQFGASLGAATARRDG